jgi:hypothetical protein
MLTTANMAVLIYEEYYYMDELALRWPRFVRSFPA